jgi:hypothetical protein
MSLQSSGYAIHLNPAWREKANFIIDARIEGEKEKFEQLWVKKLEGKKKQFELCTIPAFLHDMALGDVLETVGENEGELVVNKVVSRSGHHSFRVWFGESKAAQKAAVISDLKNMAGVSMELYSDDLLCVDVSNGEEAHKMQNYLQKKETEKKIMFENVDIKLDF